MLRGVLRGSRTFLSATPPRLGAMSSSVTVLPPPVKSTSDEKDYRVIRLKNGLRALLISDTRYPLEKLDEEEKAGLSAADDESDSEEESTDDEDDDGDSDEDGSEDGGPDSKRSRREEGSSSTGLKKSAAGLCINVGSFSDPEDIPGLAHFLEHMVFMGSEKYPDENSFDEFIQKSGGYDNASTDCETTVFYFETQRKSFKEGLDRFAQFFINPLMAKEAMQREREAVDSEFEMALPSDWNRRQQLFGSLAKEHHPMGKFMWGSLKSLSPKGIDDDEMHRRLHEFKDRHYTAQSMTLTVQAQETLDTLQEWVLETFSDVPNNGLERETFDHLSPPFETPAFSKLYQVVPMSNVHQVDLSWALPALMDTYRVKPLHYLSYIIGHEGKGSLISYLRERVWALSLTAGNAGDGFEFNSTFSIFSIGIVLTEEGFEHISEVLEAVFAYLSMMAPEDHSERIYKEIQRIEEINFAFGEEKQVAENVESLCEMMAFYPSELILTGDELMFEYNEEVISKCFSYLSACDVNVVLTSVEYAGQTDKREPYFNTHYSCLDIPDDWRAAWMNPTMCPAKFHLPTPNLFVAENTALKPIPVDVPLYPVKILDCDQGELFYKPDAIFKQPRAHYNFCLLSPAVFGSARNSACLDVLANCIAQVMVEETYPADLAQLSFSFYAGENGLVIKISGLDDKLPALLDVILDKVRDVGKLCTEQMFTAVRDQTKKNYYNGFIKPMKLVREVRISVLQVGYNNALDKHAVVSNITREELFAYAKEFMSKVYVQGLVQGNVTQEQAVTCFRKFEKLGCGRLPRRELPEIRCRRLEDGERLLRVDGINKMDGNTAVTNYYQQGPGTIASHGLLEVVESLMSEPVFDELRTKEQLGYTVFSMLRNSFGISGFTITVCAQASKFSPDRVDERIDNFLHEFLTEKLEEMSPEEYQSKVQTLIKDRKSADVTLEEEVGRNWGEIGSREYVFDRFEKDVAVFESLRYKSEVIDALRKLTKGGKHFKKLSVQIVGNPNVVKKKGDEEESKADPNGTFELVHTDVAGHKKKDQFILDVGAYREELKVYPVTKMMS